MTRKPDAHEPNDSPHATVPGAAAAGTGDPIGFLNSVVPRKVAAQASGGIRATIVVTVQQGTVAISIVPPFTWEAIMTPETVDDLIGALTQARTDAVAAGRRKQAPPTGSREHAR